MTTPPLSLGAIRQPAFLYGADGRIAEANERAELLAERPLAGRSVAEAASLFAPRAPDGRPLVPAELPAARALAGDDAIEVPLEITAADGRTISVLATATPIRTGGAIAGALVIWQDVSERRAVEAALRKSVETVRTLIDSPSDMALLLDANGTVLAINDTYAAILGRPAEDLEGANIWEVMPPDVVGRRREQFDRAVASRRAVRFEEDRDGRWFDSLVEPVLSGTGEVEQVAIIARDITERKRAEEALRPSEERLRLALESAEIGIWDRDVATDRVTISPEFLRRYGLEAESVTSYETWERVIHPDDRALVEAGRRASVATGAPLDLDFRVTLPSGERLWLQFRGRDVLDERGALARVIGVLIDVTPRKRAEAALEGVNRILSAALTSETEEELGETCLEVAEAITQSRFGFIGEVNAEGLHDIAISDPGWEACAITDPSGHRRPAGGLSLRGLFGRVLREGRSLLTNDPAGHPDSVGTPPGHPRLTAFLGVPLVRDGSTIGMLGVANREGGYTAAEQRLLEAIAPAVVEAFGRKRAEQDLKRYTGQLRTSNEELERFAYVASHDLQEPLRNIVSFSQLLERRYKGKLDADADEYIEFIVEGGTRMQTLIRDLLEVSRVQTGARPPAPTDAGETVADAVRSLELPIREAGATVTVGEMPQVMADPAQLAQVFTNLIANAVKYRRPAVPPAVTISSRRLNGMWEFAVADNGIGIEPEYHDRIFEMFRRLHTHDEYEGTGIGLAVVRRIVERHGGTVRVESTPGEGSTFFFTLPAA